MTTVPAKAPSSTPSAQSTPAQSQPAPKPSVMLASPGTNGRTADASACITRLSPPDDNGVASELWEQALRRPLAEFLSRPGKSIRANIVSCTWNLGGALMNPSLDSAHRERASVPSSLPFLIELIHSGSLIIDDIQDGSKSRRGLPALHELYGLPIALNAGTSLYFHALNLVEGLGLPAASELALFRAVTRTMLSCHHGQALDLAVQVSEARQDEIEPMVRSITDQKTGGLMGLAATIGPIAQDAPTDLVAALRRFGETLGRGLQMLNDLADLTGRSRGEQEKRFEDLARGRATWPWAWLAEETGPAAFQSLQAESKRATRFADPSAEPVCALGQEMLRRLGRCPERRARLVLAEGLETLRRDLGQNVDLGPLAAEIRRLEEGYAPGP